MNVNVSKDVMLFNSLPGFRTKQALNLSSFLKWNTKRMWEGFLMSRDALVVGINTYNHLQNLKSSQTAPVLSSCSKTEFRNMQPFSANGFYMCFRIHMNDVIMICDN